MRLHRLHIDGYLCFDDFALDFGPGLNVIHGPNEAGKSTLVRFIRYVLFGPPRLTAQRGLPLSGSKYGGTLWLGPEPLRVERHDKDLKLTADGVPRPQSDLDALLGQFDQSAFDAVYACDIDDLQQMGALQADALRRKLFASTVLGTSIDIDAVEERWNKRRRVLATRGRSGVLWRLEQTLRAAREELEEARLRAMELPVMHDRLDELDLTVEDHEAQLQEVRQTVGTLEALQAARGAVARWQTLRQWRAEHPDPPTGRAAELLAERAALEALDRVAGLRAAEARVDELQSEVADREARIEALDQQIEAVEARWPARAHAGPGELRELRPAIEQWREEAVQRETERGAVDRELATIQREIERLSSPVPVAEVPAGALQWAERRTAMAERAAELDEERARRRLLDETPRSPIRQRATSRSGRPRWPLAVRAVGIALFLLLVALIVLLLLRGLGDTVTWVILVAATVGIAALVYAQVRELWQQRPGPSAGALAELAQHDAAIAVREHSLQQWVAAGTEAAGAIEAEAPPDLAAALALAEEVAGLREAERRAAVAEEARRDALAAQQHALAEAGARRSALDEPTPREAELRARVIAAGGETIAPSDWLAWVGDHLEVEALDAQRADLQGALDAARTRLGREQIELTEARRRVGPTPPSGTADWATWSDGVRALAAQLGEPPPEDAATWLAEQQAREQGWRERDAELGRVEALIRSSAPDVDLDALAGQDPERIDAELIDARTELAEVRRSMDALVEQRGALKQAIEELSASARVPDAAERVSRLRAAVHEARVELAEIELASHLLRETWERYVRERQPAVLRRASELLTQASDGAMVGVKEHDRRLHVESADGATREPDALSRGSREMLYLVIRLALALEHADRTALPLLLDDVLVNQDPERSRQIAQILRAVGEEHQVILMTCRPEVRDLLVEVDERATVIELSRD